jgi:DNA-binding MarR family transcriptional regulator
MLQRTVRKLTIVKGCEFVKCWHNSFSGMMSIGNELRRPIPHAFIPEQLRGMSMTQLWTIQYIYENEKEGVYQKDIENFLRIRRSSVSSLLGKMEKGGLLLRVPVPEDARLKRLILTPEGREHYQTIEKINQRIEDYLVRTLTQEEREFLGSILKKIAENLSTLTSETSEGDIKPQINQDEG